MMLKLGSQTTFGRVRAVMFIGGERYYMMLERGVVSLIPAVTVELSIYNNLTRREKK